MMRQTGKKQGRKWLLYVLLIFSVLGALRIAPASEAAKKPAKVKKVKVSSITTNSMKVTWARAKNAKTYEIQYRKSYEKHWTSNSQALRSFKMRFLDPGTTYKIRVRGRNGKKYGKWSSTVTRKTKDSPAPANPGNISPIDPPKAVWPTYLGEHQITVQWYKEADASEYEVVCTGGAGGKTTIRCTANEATFTSLQPKTAYRIEVYSLSGTSKSSICASLDTATLSGNEMKVTGEYVPYSCSMTHFTVGEDEGAIPKLYDQDTDGMHYYYPGVDLPEITIQGGRMSQFGSDAEKTISGTTTYRVGDQITDVLGTTVTIQSLVLQGWNEYEAHDYYQLLINGQIFVEW